MYQKSCIRETLNLSTDADSSTDKYIYFFLPVLANKWPQNKLHLEGTHIHIATDIVTLWLNQPTGRFIENICIIKTKKPFIKKKKTTKSFRFSNIPKDTTTKNLKVSREKKLIIKKGFLFYQLKEYRFLPEFSFSHFRILG